MISGVAAHLLKSALHLFMISGAAALLLEFMFCNSSRYMISGTAALLLKFLFCGTAAHCMLMFRSDHAGSCFYASAIF